MTPARTGLALACAAAAVVAAASYGTAAPFSAVLAAHDGIILAQHKDGDHAEAQKADLTPDQEFALWIAQVRGHLLIGDDLVKESKWKAAYPHFEHPIEELYKVIAPRLADYKVPPFDGALKTLADAVKGHKTTDYATAKKALDDLLATADAGLKEKEANWASFLVGVAIETWKSSTEEYESAIEKGRIARPVEYQDARGFIWEAERLIESVAGPLGQKDPDGLKQVRAALADLKKVFPTPVPPKTPVKTHEEMVALVNKVVAAAGKLM